MFRKLKSLPLVTPSGLVLQRQLCPVGESGMFEEKIVDLEKLKLPDPKLYDLKTLVKNHVELRQENSVIFDSGEIDPRISSAFKETETETETETNSETEKV